MEIASATKPKVILTEAERRLATFVGTKRQTTNDAMGVPDRKQGPQDALAAHIEACGAEIAFAKLANVYPDLTTHVRHGGWDVELPNQCRVDVKHTVYANGCLLIAYTSAHDADVAVLMTGSLEMGYTYHGWIGMSEIITEQRRNHSRNGGPYEVPQSALSMSWPIPVP